jgi:predicted RNA-binding protein YlxR (DUF448 family)
MRKISRARPAEKPVPQRTCVACRSARPKRELVRLVHAGGGEIEIDAAAKKAGRGAYLCRDRACWEKAMKGAGLEKALRCSLTRNDRERLLENGRKMLKELTSA